MGARLRHEAAMMIARLELEAALQVSAPPH
jgi:hypothetical protein